LEFGEEASLLSLSSRLLLSSPSPLLFFQQRKALEFGEEAYRIELAQKKGKIPMWNSEKHQEDFSGENGENNVSPKRKSRDRKKTKKAIEGDLEDETSEEGSDLEIGKKKIRDKRKKSEKERGDKTSEEDSDVEIIAIIEAFTEDNEESNTEKVKNSGKGEKNESERTKKRKVVPRKHSGPKKKKK
jgi:hypothetical protein